MHFTLFDLIYGAGWIFGFFVSLVAMVWGWIRWIRREKGWSILSLSSLIAFALASASALLVAAMMAYELAIREFTYDDSSLMRICAWGALISLSALVLALMGVWRPNSIRWHALVCSFGTLVFWLMAAAGE
ncbi:MAG: hypothetical protein WBA18_03700 [Terracidiphilus sp.]